MSSSRSRFVAATTRTSTGIAPVPPTGIASRSCNTRSSLTCVAGDISPISSRKKVPPRAAADLLLQLRVLGLEQALLRGAPADGYEIVVRERLLDVVESALVHRLDGGLERGLRGHEDHRRLGVLVPDRGQNVRARDTGHLDVGEDDVGRRRLQLLQAGLAALRGGHVEAFALEENPEHIQDPHLVVDHKNRWLVSHAPLLDIAAGTLRPQRTAGNWTSCGSCGLLL